MKINNNYGKAFLLSMTLVAAQLISCAPAQKAPARAIAIFVIGRVQLTRPGEPARQVAHKEDLRKGDLIQTGPDSTLVFQIGEASVIKIDSNTSVSFTALLEKGETMLQLDRGKVTSGIRHLSKGENFQIRTRTSIAAVRGTEFSVASTGDRSVVAVSTGSVGVRQVTAGTEAKDEKSIEKGSAAVIKGKIETRPLTKEEKKEFSEFEKIEPVRDIDNKSESDIKKIEADHLKDPDKIGDDKKSTTDKNDKKNIGNNTVNAGNNEGKKAVAWAGKQVYRSSEPVIVSYREVPPNRNCWISLAKAGSPDGRHETYQWTYGATAGQMNFGALNLQPGTYEIQMHFSRGNTVNKRFYFRVQ